MKAVMGVALIGAAFAFAPAVVGALDPTMGMGSTAIGLGSLGAITYGSIAMFGVSMLLRGVSQMLAPQQKTSSQAQDQANSYISAGPTNIVHQGAVVPLVYGEVRAGSVPISNGVSNTRLEDDDDGDDDVESKNLLAIQNYTKNVPFETRLPMCLF